MSYNFKSAISNRSFSFCLIFFDNYGKIYDVILDKKLKILYERILSFIILYERILSFIIFDNTVYM